MSHISFCFPSFTQPTVGHAMCAEDVCAGEVATSDPWYLRKRVVHGEISMAIWHKGIRSAVLIFVER